MSTEQVSSFQQLLTNCLVSKGTVQSFGETTWAVARVELSEFVQREQFCVEKERNYLHGLGLDWVTTFFAVPVISKVSGVKPN